MTTSNPVSEQPPASHTEYEFTDQQNAIFATLGGSMRFVALVTIVAGLVEAGSAAASLVSRNLGASISTAAIAVLLFVVGIWTLKASRHVNAIVATRGNDIAHLMSAMQQLTRLYVLQKWSFILMILVAVLGLFVSASTPVTGAGGAAPDQTNDGTR